MASTSTRNSNVDSQKVCNRIPGDPCRGSPKRTTMRSPSRRKPRTTLTYSVLSHGRMFIFPS